MFKIFLWLCLIASPLFGTTHPDLHTITTALRNTPVQLLTNVSLKGTYGWYVENGDTVLSALNKGKVILESSVEQEEPSPLPENVTVVEHVSGLLKQESHFSECYPGLAEVFPLSLTERIKKKHLRSSLSSDL